MFSWAFLSPPLSSSRPLIRSVPPPFLPSVPPYARPLFPSFFFLCFLPPTSLSSHPLFPFPSVMKFSRSLRIFLPLQMIT